ncbi:hypothetical protein PRUPE_2G062800 [Prunus persica]|uniref:Uncharacterized protein n=1 Tax=Prunus persica TaxID=3760 RepID=A0A251QC12_PRUPE|nr:hypothetical protein PRUPE_2G062800 [Prunus persica]
MPLLNHLMIMKYKKFKRHALRLNLQIPKDEVLEKKKKGRWKAKGGKGKGMLIEIYKGCIVTKEAARNIGVLFKQEIKGAWVKFSDYLETQVNLLIELFIEAGYTYTCSEEELKVAFTGHIKKKIAD